MMCLRAALWCVRSSLNGSSDRDKTVREVLSDGNGRNRRHGWSVDNKKSLSAWDSKRASWFLCLLHMFNFVAETVR